MKYDVVVIGAGLAGMTAALRSLELGSRVLVVAAGESTLGQMSGCLDLCGNTSDPWLAIRQLQGIAGHPYTLTNEQEIRESLSFFVDQTEASCPYRFPVDSEHNSWVPTPVGTFRPTYLLPKGQEAGAAQHRSVAVVDIGCLQDFDAGLLVAGMNGRGFQWQAETIDIDYPRKQANNLELAIFLDQRWPVLKDKLLPRLNSVAAVAFPAVLGLARHRMILRELEAAFGLPVFEIPSLPPSVPGIRLASALKERLRAVGGEMLYGFPACIASTRDSLCSSIMVETPGRPRQIEAGSFILATGGVLGGGIVIERDRFLELLMDLPVIPSPHSTDSSFFAPGAHGYTRCGVLVNDSLQPIDAAGRVLLNNVYCAGRILAGYDPFSERDGVGVAIATGYKAASCAGLKGKEPEWTDPDTCLTTV